MKAVEILITTSFCLLTVFFSCKGKKFQNAEIEYAENIDEGFVVNKSYAIGDVRRYGVVPNEKISDVNLENALIVSEKGVNLFFPKGTYDCGLNIDSKKNIFIKFDNAEFLDVIHITDENGTNSENINLSGTLITYDRFGTYGSNNIKIDSLILKSNSKKHKRGYESRGCHIYSRTNNLTINYLQIDGLSDDQPNNHAALAVDGDFPKKIIIKKAVINSSERNGVYLTGANHKIDTLIIKNWGGGSAKDMSQIQGTEMGENQFFYGIWFNECYNTNIGFLKLENQKKLDKTVGINFDIGDKNYPIIIKGLVNSHETKKNKYSGEIIINKQ